MSENKDSSIPTVIFTITLALAGLAAFFAPKVMEKCKEMCGETNCCEPAPAVTKNKKRKKKVVRRKRKKMGRGAKVVYNLVGD